VIFVDEGQRTSGECDWRDWGRRWRQDEVAFELAVFVDRSGAIDARVKAVVRAELGEHGAFGQQLGGGGGDKGLFASHE